MGSSYLHPVSWLLESSKHDEMRVQSVNFSIQHLWLGQSLLQDVFPHPSSWRNPPSEWLYFAVQVHMAPRRHLDSQGPKSFRSLHFYTFLAIFFYAVRTTENGTPEASWPFVHLFREKHLQIFAFFFFPVVLGKTTDK